MIFRGDWVDSASECGGVPPLWYHFARKGGISGKPNHHSVFLQEGTVSSYRTVAPLWLGAESGLSILSVSADGQSFADFYLDKAVKIKGILPDGLSDKQLGILI